jgi:hypothetical protein
MAPGAYSLLAVPARPAGAGGVLTVLLMPATIAAVHSQRSGHRATYTRTFAPTTRGPGRSPDRFAADGTALADIARMRPRWADQMTSRASSRRLATSCCVRPPVC